MKIYIDQSGKIEQTNLNTVIALSNDIRVSVLLKKQDKRILEKLFKKQNKGKLFPYFTFAASVALVIKAAHPKNKIIIDTEYQGHENLIKEKIIEYLELLKIRGQFHLEFSRIGKSSPAHILAVLVGNKKTAPTMIIKLKDILNLVLETKNDRVSRY